MAGKFHVKYASVLEMGMSKNRPQGLRLESACGWAWLGLLVFSLQIQAATTFMGATSATSGSSGASQLSLVYPSGISTEDILIAQVAIRGNRIITSPSGWALINRTNNGSILTQAVYWKVAGVSNPASQTWNFSASGRAAGAMIAYRGVDLVTPVNVLSIGTNGSSTSVTANSVTPTVTATRLMALYAQADGQTSYTAPTGMTERVDINTSAGPNGISVGTTDEAYTGGTAATGARVATTTQSAASVAHLIALQPATAVSSVLHHLEIQHVSGSGMTCAPSTLTITACQDAGCTSPYTGGVTGTLAGAGAPTVNWVSGADFNIPSGSSSTNVSVQVTTAGSVLFGISGSSPVPVNSTTCNFGSPACTFTAADAGFLISVSDHVAETSEMVTVSAIKKADSSLTCTPAFASVSKAVTFTCAYQNPATGTLPIRVGGRALNTGNSANAACDTTGQTVTLAFNASGVATTTLQYADVGDIQLNARYSGSSGTESGLVLTGSDPFIAAPASFGFGAITSAPIKAGKTFSATVTALNAAGNPTLNFGRETPAENVTLTHTRVQPTGTGAVDGIFSGGVGSFTNGSATASNLVWSEVGIINLQAALTSASYLGSGLTVTGGINVGPFVPDHFDTVVTQGCSSGGFTYSAQAFGVQIKAMNGAATPAITQNYDGTANTTPNFAKTVTLSDVNAAGVGTLAPPTVLLTRFVAGIANATPAYTFSQLKTSPTTIKLRAVDASASSAGFTEGTADIRAGRARLNNAYGSELIGLPMPFRVEYWDGSAWILNTLDRCTGNTALGATNGVSLALAPPSGWPPGGGCVQDSGSPGLSGAGCATAGPSERQYKEGGAASFAGDFNLWFRAPGSGNSGSVTVTADVPSWLEYPWDGVTVSDPTARATFGIYKTSIIYRRENY